MEKICLARRISESSRPVEIQPEQTVLQEGHIAITPSQLVHSLIQTLLAEGPQDLKQLTGSQKFELEIVCDPESRFSLTVNITPVREKPAGKWLTAVEAAQQFRLSKTTVYRELLAGKLAGIKIGRQWRIPASGNLSDLG